MSKSGFRRVLCATALAATVLGSSLSADNAWNNYHWARTSNPFTLTVVNSLTSDWDLYADVSVSDWTASSVLDLTQKDESLDDRGRRRCEGPAGQVRICNMTFGFNQWLGIAGISIDTDGHIFTGYVKLNDSYFNTSYYNTDLWKQSVVCQELGHVLGLDHQDEDFDNEPLFSCMDYQDPPFAEPDDHDLAQLADIYAHLDGFNSYITESGGGGGGGGTCNAPPGKGCNKVGVPQGEGRGEWGISLGRRGAKERFLRIDPDGTRHVTFVTWAQGR